MTTRFNESPLPSSRRPLNTFDFWVTGTGSFPLDMLRYDACWPCSTTDAMNIDADERRSIHLRSFTQPTPDRWASFMWSMSTKEFRA